VESRLVFFADILGFGALSLVPGAEGAQDALSAVSGLLDRSDVLGDLLNWPGWEERYALSDSLFLVSSDVEGAVAAAAEVFFNLAFITHAGSAPVLMRGGLAQGEAFQVPPIFPASAKANLVGAAVVKAVRLEGSALKGPRLFLDEATADQIQRSSANVKDLLNRQGDSWDLLWLLPPVLTRANGELIGQLCQRIIALVERHGRTPSIAQQYLGYLDLMVRSLVRLSEQSPEQAVTALRLADWEGRLSSLEELLATPELLVVNSMRKLGDFIRDDQDREKR